MSEHSYIGLLKLTDAQVNNALWKVHLINDPDIVYSGSAGLVMSEKQDSRGQITSKAKTDSYAIPVTDTDFISGMLRQESNIRPNRIFTADSNIILYRAGALAPAKLQEITAKVVQLLTQ